MLRRITAASLILVAACSGTRGGIFGSGKPLSYAQYCSLGRGMQAEAIQKAFGPPGNVFEQDGKVRGLAYACEDASGQVLQLRMVFAEDGGLDSWVLGDKKAAEPAATAPTPKEPAGAS